MDKKIFFVIVICTLWLKNYSQTTFVHKPDELKKYEGIWQWVDGRDTFIINLKIDSLCKSQKNKDSSTEKLVLYGWHRYVENGFEAESDLKNTGDYKKFSLLGTPVSAECTSYLGLMFYDITRDKYFRIFFKFINKEQTMALWESNPQERSGGSGLTPKIYGGQTIPSPLILIKITN